VSGNIVNKDLMRRKEALREKEKRQKPEKPIKERG
jgi:hypothetical protein